MAIEIRVGDYGNIWRFTVLDDGDPFDISASESRTLVMVDEDGTRTEKSLALYEGGSGGKCQYVVEDGLISAGGRIKCQLVLGFPTALYHSKPFTITIGTNI